ncbi:disease resistance protein RPV1-like isoform X1 [Daucus carota subsp. sativus]|uniref:disease resistance protein RPV1-like isoform X1 n=1 Tax=Daucus carota subsp. sativus TaxID=79200 RepID=UPI0007F017DB|nr:PREDICTED: disease resistance protein TAO1-like isoform X1 [Daucus carota subsp. sativus]
MYCSSKIDCKLTSQYHYLASMVQFILSITRSISAIAMEHYNHWLVVLIWVLPVLVILTIITIIIRSILTRDRPCVDPPSNPFAAPSSTSSSPPGSWDVFLSFHGGDTRGSFTAHLYKALHDAGVRTFMDEPELRTGEEISAGLFNAIHGSKMCVVVLSENFAYSKWCLKELVEIISCQRTKGLVVVPVFYYVDPSDVRHRRKGFMEGLRSQKNAGSVEMVQKWETALAAVGRIKGHHLQKHANENEADVVQKIMNVALLQASMKVHGEEHLFGVDSVIEEIYKKLQMELNEVRVIGICGMGGIGKTTIAKAFYNNYFNKFVISCFIENVKQKSQGADPLVWLLEQLLVKLLRKNDFKVTDVGSGIRLLKEILCFNKALIVLDDLDQSIPSDLQIKLCNLASPGSRIIFTTRDANLLNQLKEDIPEVDIYTVKKLGQNDSLELFSYHTFRKSMPPEMFRELSAEFVTYAGGLPLALKMLGSSLRGRNHVSFWEAMLIKVQKIPMDQIQEILQLSYDELDETEKAIFLDIVFFFVGNDKDDAVYAFKSCDFYPDLGIPVLEERCLITVDECNRLQMHNLIQDMGRKVARKEFNQGNGRYLRLYQENACERLQNLEGADHIELLLLDLTRSKARQLTTKIFRKLCKLRLLEIIDPHNILSGDLKNSCPELRYMRWSHSPWTSVNAKFRSQRLVCLDMSYNRLDSSWKPPASLKSLNMSYSKLKSIPNLSELKVLERLLLQGCQNLSKVPSTISQLSKLGHLDMGSCRLLRELPESIGQLTLLRLFNLSHCVNLNQLPETITQLTRLNHLKLECCYNLKRLPERIGNMQGLITFHARWSGIEQLPDSFGELINLVHLNLFWCKNLTALPDSICKLMFLKELNLGGSHKLKRLPEELGKMQSLERLYAGCEEINELPDSIGELSSLQVLNLSACRNLRYLPGHFLVYTFPHRMEK